MFLFILGFIVFSSFCSFLTVRILNLPCTIELFLVPLAYYFRKSFFIPRKDYIGVVLFVLLGIFIGLLNSVYFFTDIIPIARCFFLGALAFVFAKNNTIFKNLDNLYIFSFGVFMGDLLNAYILMKTVLGTEFDKQYAVDINIIFSVLWPILTILYKKPSHLIAVFLLVPILSFLSVSRGISTFFTIGIILAFLLKIYKRPSKIIIAMAFLSVSFIVLSSLYYNSENNIRKFSPSMHFRMYKKMSSYGKNNIDKDRIRPYIWAFDNLSYYVVPRGFLGKKFLTKSDGKNTPMMAPWDSAYMEFLYTFGFLLLLVLVLIYLYKLYICFILYNRTNEVIFAVSCAMLSLLFVEHVFTYGLIRSPFMVFCNGGFLGYIWKITSHPESLKGNLISKKQKL
ncbi:hypothetical protein D0T85_06675 [Bacteroides sp. 519]|nr:hypothetical protein [Bacteroides sp. 519]